MDLRDKAASLGLETEFHDAFGRMQRADDRALSAVIDALGSTPAISASGTPKLPAYEGGAVRGWILAAQLYSLRSQRSWGIGDFGDLAALLRTAAAAGAAGVGLNPLHVLFHDDASDCSPYWPSSRLFLNPLYIDLERVPELDQTERDRFRDRIAQLNTLDIIDYGGVAKLKRAALWRTFENFQGGGDAAREAAFTKYRDDQGIRLARFCVFEALRRRLSGPWWEWPEEWRKPTDERVQAFLVGERSAWVIAYEQWLAHTQLQDCAQLARDLGMSVGLYLDIAVGVRPDGFDAWSEQTAIFSKLVVGAPPDLLNVKGQDWGLAGYSPSGLAEQKYQPFRDMLAASMKYAGAVRIDHVLGLKRIYLIPIGFSPDQGVYLNMPLEELLAVLAEESRLHRCIVIGEDLGTVPEGFREKLAEWGIWSYRVMIFERDWKSGSFLPARDYARNALATFSTHDLPPFASWITGADRALRESLGMDPGETVEERQLALKALDYALSGALGGGFIEIVKWLSKTPSRLIALSIEDALGVAGQVNVPGTTSEHPNWRRRLPLDVDDDRFAGTIQRIGRAASRAT